MVSMSGRKNEEEGGGGSEAVGRVIEKSLLRWCSITAEDG
jgi:hypothetical protein